MVLRNSGLTPKEQRVAKGIADVNSPSNLECRQATRLTAVCSCTRVVCLNLWLCFLFQDVLDTYLALPKCARSTYQVLKQYNGVSPFVPVNSTGLYGPIIRLIELSLKQWSPKCRSVFFFVIAVREHGGVDLQPVGDPPQVLHHRLHVTVHVSVDSIETLLYFCDGDESQAHELAKIVSNSSVISEGFKHLHRLDHRFQPLAWVSRGEVTESGKEPVAHGFPGYLVEQTTA
ncbi:Asparagine synthetase [glutamine-hydrolyzing] 3 [Frankliniella fusca]|uniref:Asparagine synthetase [glutamine-hydrolyzing] 3 n=1 Tax=Frankliniella fusca TaxID=407009 RepID=A0AAE1GWD8_9NEOP|nr:Asparagine synthetase [glutamine-hydrolyzing] 3 [Frankliniella fusca]